MLHKGYIVRRCHEFLKKRKIIVVQNYPIIFYKYPVLLYVCTKCNISHQTSVKCDDQNTYDYQGRRRTAAAAAATVIQ